MLDERHAVQLWYRYIALTCQSLYFVQAAVVSSSPHTASRGHIAASATTVHRLRLIQASHLSRNSLNSGKNFDVLKSP